jgi:2-methylcitrate dehydratase
VRNHHVRVWPSTETHAREEELAWTIAAFATSNPRVTDAVTEMVACRVVDNAAVALAAINRQPVASARAMALCHPREGGATLYGLPPETRVHAEWAAWANATAVRELDYHDTFLAADYAHPGDSLAPIIAIAQQTGQNGKDLLRAAAVAYEVHVALVKAISLHAHKKDHMAHLLPASVAGIGALLNLPTDTVYHAVNQAVHLGFSTRQSRKGGITSWKAYVPGYSGKTAIEAVDRAMRGEGAPNPVYEGADSVIAWMLDGPDGSYMVTLPEPGEAPEGILETYTKAHSAEYQAQALIDLAIEVRGGVDLSRVEKVRLHTSHHTHYVIGTGANDPQKMDPEASRETLDHSIMYILAVALEDGAWHHENSYTSERAARPETVALWRKVETREDPVWTARYHADDPSERAFGGRLEIIMDNGQVISAEKAVADAHPNGAKPWAWNDYVSKFDSLTANMIARSERDRFIGAAQNLAGLAATDLQILHPELPEGATAPTTPTGKGLFDWGLSALL